MCCSAYVAIPWNMAVPVIEAVMDAIADAVIDQLAISINQLTSKLNGS